VTVFSSCGAIRQLGASQRAEPRIALWSTLGLLDLVKLSVDVRQFDCQTTQLAYHYCAPLLKQRAALLAAHLVRV